MPINLESLIYKSVPFTYFFVFRRALYYSILQKKKKKSVLIDHVYHTMEEHQKINAREANKVKL